MKRSVPQSGVSRRQMFKKTALAASALPLAGKLAAQAPQAAQGGAAPGRGGRGGGRGGAQGGTGAIKVLLITKFHPFNREPFFLMFDSFGSDITWTHVEQPAAQVFFNPDLAKAYDVFVLYDAFAGRVRRAKPDGTFENVETEPTPELRRNFKALLQQGKGFVFFHHALASWAHTWPEYVEVMGGAADWGSPLKGIRGKDYAFSGFKGKTAQHVTVVDKTHPIVQGIGDGFDIVDEAYLCPMFEDSVHPILRTNFEPKVSNFPSQLQRPPVAGDPKFADHPDGSNMTGWVKTAENSPIVYIQHGHDEEAWQNPAFKTIMLNSIKWAASKDAMDWAKKNPKKIFS
jgi:uncharacterized protein